MLQGSPRRRALDPGLLRLQHRAQLHSQTDRRGGEREAESNFGREGGGVRGDGPQPHPGSRPPHPCPEPRRRGAGGQPGGSQPEVGRQRSIVKASQRLNHLMIQKSMGKGEGRAEGVASRRAAAAPPFPRRHLGQRRGGSGVTPEPAAPRTAPESLRCLQHLGQRRERRALPGGERGKWGEKAEFGPLRLGDPGTPHPARVNAPIGRQAIWGMSLPTRRHLGA